MSQQINCQELNNKLAELQKLKTQFDVAIESKDLPQARELDSKLDEAIMDFEGELLVAINPEVASKNEEFLRCNFDLWYGADAKEVKIVPMGVNLPNQNWPKLKDDVNPDKFGEYAFNLETQDLDFKKMKIFIPDLKFLEKEKKTIAEVVEYVVATYGDEYYIPGVEYWRWLCEHKDIDDLPLKDKNFDGLKESLTKYGHRCLFFGSIIRELVGRWRVPSVNFDKDKSTSKWINRSLDLRRPFAEGDHVVLLQKVGVVDKSEPFIVVDHQPDFI